MDRLRDLEVFLAIASEGSLAGAAGRMSMSAPAVTRALARLEDRLGAALFVRTTRSVSMTSAGEAFAPRARQVLEAMAFAEAAVIDGPRLRGALTLTAPRHLGRIVIAPIVARFLEAHPDVEARMILADRLADLLDERIDVGVRIGRLEDASSIARKVGVVSQRVVASPAYLARHGAPTSLEDLKAHRLIAFTGRLTKGRLRVAGGSVPFTPAHIAVDCAATALELAEQSVGLAPLWSYQCAASVRDGRLAPVLAEFMPDPSPCQFVWPERRFENALVRAFTDFAQPIVHESLRDAEAIAKT